MPKKAILTDRLSENIFILLLSDDSASSYITPSIVTFTCTDANTLEAGVDESEFTGFVVCRNDHAYVTYILTAAAACEENEVTLAERLAVNAHAVIILES